MPTSWRSRPQGHRYRTAVIATTTSFQRHPDVTNAAQYSRVSHLDVPAPKDPFLQQCLHRQRPKDNKTAHLHSTYTLIAYLFCLFSFLLRSRTRKLCAASIHISITRSRCRPIRQKDGQPRSSICRVWALLGSALHGFFSLSLIGLAEAARLVGNP